MAVLLYQHNGEGVGAYDSDQYDSDVVSNQLMRMCGREVDNLTFVLRPSPLE